VPSDSSERKWIAVHYQVVIVGGGSAGISIAARLLRGAKALSGHVAIMDPASKHYYQPLWTLVGGGATKKEVTERDEASVIPDGAVWIKEAVKEFAPDANQVMTEQGQTITYDYLVVAAGIQIDWGRVKGLPDTIGKNGVCSNYSFEYVSQL